MTNLSRRSAWLGTFLVAIACAAPAWADGSPADAFFDQGRAAAKAGDWTTALARFQRSQALDPAAGTLFNIADCEQHLGKVASAWQHTQQVVTQLPVNDDRLPLAKQMAAALAARVPWLKIELAPGVPQFTKVQRDDIELAGPSLGTEQPVDPGAHVVVVAAPAHQRRRLNITVTEGQHKAITVEPGEAEDEATPAPAASAAAGAPSAATATGIPIAPESPAVNARSGGNKKMLGYVFGGVGGASLLVGAATGIMVFGKKGTITDHCDSTKACDQEGLDAGSAAQTLGTIGTIGFVVGAVGLGAGAYLLFAGGGKAAPATALSTTVLPGGGGVSVSREF